MWAKLLIFLLTLTYCFPLPVRMIYSFYKYFISLISLIIYTSCLSLAGHCPVDKDTIHALFCLFSDDDVAPSLPVLFSGLSACPPQQVLSISLLMRSPQPLTIDSATEARLDQNIPWPSAAWLNSHAPLWKEAQVGRIEKWKGVYWSKCGPHVFSKVISIFSLLCLTEKQQQLCWVVENKKSKLKELLVGRLIFLYFKAWYNLFLTDS